MPFFENANKKKRQPAQNNRWWVSALKRTDGSAILQVPTTLKKYTELCKIAVTLSGINLRDIDKEYRTYELCKLAIEDSSWAFDYVPTNIDNYAELCKLAVTKNPNILQHIPHDLRTLELCKIEIESRGLKKSWIIELNSGLIIIDERNQQSNDEL